MTHADDVLNSIDHALHDWDTSADAMRWTPEVPKPPAVPTVIDMLPSMVRVARVVQEANENLVRAFSNMVTQVVKLQVQIRRLVDGQLEAEAQIRRSAMHTAYRRRQKRRNRR